MKNKRPHYEVMQIAEQIVSRLEVACHRLEIAGSLRRGAGMVGDIEIVAVPRLEVDLFGVPTGKSEVDRLIADWKMVIVKDGQKQKQFIVETTGGYEYQVDLFLQPDPATWGVNFLIRTGSRNFSRKMVTLRSKGGYMPSGYRVQGARVWFHGELIETPEEKDIFRLWGMSYVPPKERY